MGAALMGAFGSTGTIILEEWVGWEGLLGTLLVRATAG